MKRIDVSPGGIFEFSWSPDGKWLTYVTGEGEVRLAEVETGEVRIIGPGHCPGITDDLEVVLEREDEIVTVTGAGARVLISKKDVVKDSPKRNPVLSRDGKKVLFCVCDVFDKVSQSQNAYPYRHFVAVASLRGGKPVLTADQWYGGTATWFPDGERFAHFEFDSTGGPQVHIMSATGEPEAKVAGLYPSISPDGARIALRPRGGGSLVVCTAKGDWADGNIDTTVLRIPLSVATRASATPPIWLDNRLVLVDEGGQVWRIDTKRDKAEEMKKLPVPTTRRKHSMIASPDRTLLAVEVQGESEFELRVVPIG